MFAKFKGGNIMIEERDDILVLIDENGDEEEFEYIDSIQMDGKEYIVLTPLNQNEQNEDSDDNFEEEVVILRVDAKENGEESFVTVDDENELDAVFEEFKNRMEEDFSFEFDEDDEEFDEFEDEENDEE